MVDTEIMLIDYILCSQKWRSCIQSAKTRPGAGCSLDHELLISKIRLIVRTTTPFRYDQNQIPHDYTMEVRNRFKGLDLIDRVPEELRMELHDIVQEAGIKTIPKKKKCKKANGCLRRAYKLFWLVGGNVAVVFQESLSSTLWCHQSGLYMLIVSM